MAMATAVATARATVVAVALHERRCPTRCLMPRRPSRNSLALQQEVRMHEVHPSSLLVGSCHECRGLRGRGR
eukprot:scaffold6142_cov110-Isochrysis_galbana.AAC.6